MFRNYCKIAFRNLLKHKTFSIINIFGLSLGMAVALLIGLWVWDELSYDKNFEHYDEIAEVWQRRSGNGETVAFAGVPIPLAAAIRQSFPEDFKQVANVAMSGEWLFSYGDRVFSVTGGAAEPGVPDLLSLKMLQGSRAALKDPGTILLDRSTAKKLFGTTDPMGQPVKINNILTLKVGGVYEDFPANCTYSDISYIMPWDFYVNSWDWIRAIKDKWDNSSCGLLVQLNKKADAGKVSQKITDLLNKHIPQRDDSKTGLFLHPMRKWHLYSEFKDGVNSGGLITYVWLFSIIGFFVLLLACINFMNLSTARSEKRAREVGIRKAIGSERIQLMGQFYSESILLALFALLLSVLFVQLAMPWFNNVSGKQITVPWFNPVYWCVMTAFCLLTGLVAGSYPAIYLSSFQPIKVLKGTFRAGRLAAIPRKVLVVVQFTVSVLLITGTVIVFKQIQYAKNRPVGYDREGLLAIRETTPEVYNNYHAIRNALLATGAIVEMAESQCPVTDIWAGAGGFEWQGKPEGMKDRFANIEVRHEYGKTLSWQFLAGRDFSSAYRTDSSAIILNETAVKYMGLKDPVGQIVRCNGEAHTVIGVIKDMIMASPYEPVPPTVYSILHVGGNFINIKVNPAVSMSKALPQIEAVFKKYNPAAPFEYTFTSQEYARKFGAEERIGKLSAVFACLAILISCLGLFGLSSFMAEQRTKEIGIRKVMGASVFNLWRMLSKDFVLLVMLSCCIALPFSWYVLQQWLGQFEYRTSISVGIFVSVMAGALFIALSTVSYQAVKTALANPVKSLRAE
ncbi:ABC transporter permease [uncultured Chitinophaga sp.]|jgi:ABC-type antimicrobial peptide transport system, permease component|uniref:ABC transporter permease n=1 Tax=uncultured Chitinophaga sp. TaxID=339340 RepID=UPI00262F6775|nr:ABC transporter permease [uncultured Chitinophaga sp.]